MRWASGGRPDQFVQQLPDTSVDLAADRPNCTPHPAPLP
jgi:hypothetical protein